eukprot:5543240-Amphidinium_carterae.1
MLVGKGYTQVMDTESQSQSMLALLTRGRSRSSWSWHASISGLLQCQLSVEHFLMHHSLKRIISFHHLKSPWQKVNEEVCGNSNRHSMDSDKCLKHGIYI